MKISIVTISYNQSQYLRQAIESVLSQKEDGDVEYIVVDPGSNDGSREIILEYESKIDRVIFEKDNGPADGLNKGFSYATGEYYAFLNSDDVLNPGTISLLSMMLEKDRTVDVWHGHADIISAAGSKINRYYSRRFSMTRYIYNASAIPQPSVFFRGSLFASVGGFNQDNRVAWDHELWVRFALSGARFKRIKKSLSSYRIYPGSITCDPKCDAERDSYLERIFTEVSGRGWSHRDIYISKLCKILEVAGHPVVYFWRVINGDPLQVDANGS